MIQLSLTDCHTATISGPSAVWFFDASTSSVPLSPLAPLVSLQATLNVYPFFTGRLEKSNIRPRGRLVAVYGTLEDLGVVVQIARCHQSLASIVPCEGNPDQDWNGAHYPLRLFSSEDLTLALHDGFATGKQLPVMGVKITCFSCKGIAVAIKIVHPLADAQTMAMFMHDWSTVHQECHRQGQLCSNPTTLAASVLELPVFEPWGIDDLIAGNVEDNHANPEIMEAARRLPLHQFDWWASADGCPDALLGRTKIPP